MKLFIDTSNSEHIMVGVDDKKVTEEARKDKSQKLLTTIDKLLRGENKNLKDLTEIEVNRGPGSFTGLRVGLSVANALGWSLGIPVNGKDVKKDGPIVPIYGNIN
ncbi:MAG: tRNA (adenosine(37)-N6)-threonylcarbamoyltransferase complex dimerization subunit type 1 TsaB [bacterium]|nr:tRNA (adenosine(37)-N6)-threonylcarbamoyltransferase complex dimerization subunit type 1 TsaB [bacterium]